MDNNRNKDSFLKGAIILGAAGIIVKVMGAFFRIPLGNLIGSEGMGYYQAAYPVYTLFLTLATAGFPTALAKLVSEKTAIGDHAFFRIPLGNLIGSEGMGYYQAAYPVYTLFLTLATAGFPTALAKLVSEKTAIGDHKGANKIFKVAYMVLLITGLVSFCLLFFGAKYIVTDLMDNPGAHYAMLAIAPALLFVPAMSSYRGYFQGKRDMSKIAVSQVTEQFFRVILV